MVSYSRILFLLFWMFFSFSSTFFFLQVFLFRYSFNLSNTIIIIIIIWIRIFSWVNFVLTCFNHFLSFSLVCCVRARNIINCIYVILYKYHNIYIFMCQSINECVVCMHEHAQITTKIVFFLIWDSLAMISMGLWKKINKSMELF